MKHSIWLLLLLPCITVAQPETPFQVKHRLVPYSSLESEVLAFLPPQQDKPDIAECGLTLPHDLVHLVDTYLPFTASHSHPKSNPLSRMVYKTSSHHLHSKIQNAAFYGLSVALAIPTVRFILKLIPTVSNKEIQQSLSTTIVERSIAIFSMIIFLASRRIERKVRTTASQFTNSHCTAIEEIREHVVKGQPPFFTTHSADKTLVWDETLRCIKKLPPVSVGTVLPNVTELYEITILPENSAPVSCASFTSDGKALICGFPDGMVHVLTPSSTFSQAVL